MVEIHLKNYWDFPGGSGVENWPCNAGEVSPIPSVGTEIPQAMGQLSWVPINYRAQLLWIPHATATEKPAPSNYSSCMPQ